MSAVTDPSEIADRLAHNSSSVDDWRVNPGDWIALSRRVEFHPVVGFGLTAKPNDPRRNTYSRGEAWQSLLFLANFKPGRVTNKGVVMSLDVGQLIGGTHFLAQRWNWSRAAVRWFLDTLEREGMITRGGDKTGESNSHQNADARKNTANAITISNYTKFQLLENELDRFVTSLKQPPHNHRDGKIAATAAATETAAATATEPSGKMSKKQSSTLLPKTATATDAATATATDATTDAAIQQPQNTVSITKKEEGYSSLPPSLPTTENLRVERGVRGESKNTPAPSSPSSKKSAALHGTRLAADWFLPRSWGQWALDNFRCTETQVRLEADSFAAYWQSKPGPQAKKLDWQQTWQNWCRKAFAKVAKPRSLFNDKPASAAKPDRMAAYDKANLDEGIEFQGGGE
jgi:hypothetical protein